MLYNSRFKGQDVLKCVIEEYLMKFQTKNQQLVNLFCDTIVGDNIIGQIIKQSQHYVLSNRNYAMDIAYLFRIEQNALEPQQLINHFLIKGFKAVNVRIQATKYRAMRNELFPQYLQKYRLINQQKKFIFESKHNQLQLNSLKIQYSNLCNRDNEYDQLDTQISVIQMLSHKIKIYVKQPHSKHAIFLLIQKFITICPSKFSNDFLLHTKDDVVKFANYHTYSYIDNYSQFMKISLILQYVEFNFINLELINSEWNFLSLQKIVKKYKDFSQQMDLISKNQLQIYLDFFKNIENRAQFIQYDQNIVLIQRIQDNWLLPLSANKWINDENNCEDESKHSTYLNNLINLLNTENDKNLAVCNNSYLYNVAICGPLDISIEKLNMNSLIYYNNNPKINENIQIQQENGQNEILKQIRQELILQHPSSLVSLSITQISILNINQCINLKTIASSQNKFRNNCFLNLRQIKRIVSKDDEYMGYRSLLHDLLEYNRLEYVSIERGANITSFEPYKHNLDQLRFFYHCGKYLNRINLTFNFEHSVPKSLMVFQNLFYINADMQETNKADIFTIGKNKDLNKILNNIMQFHDESFCNFIDITAQQYQYKKQKQKQQKLKQQQVMINQTQEQQKQTQQPQQEERL